MALETFKILNGLAPPVLSNLVQKQDHKYNFRYGQKKIYVCLRSPDPPYFSAADPNLFYRQLFDANFC